MSITKCVIGNWFQVTHRLGIFSAFLKFRLLKTLEACVISLVCWILSEENLFEFSLIHGSCLLYDVVHGFLSGHSLHAKCLFMWCLSRLFVLDMSKHF